MARGFFGGDISETPVGVLIFDKNAATCDGKHICDDRVKIGGVMRFCSDRWKNSPVYAMKFYTFLMGYFFSNLDQRQHGHQREKQT